MRIEYTSNFAAHIEKYIQFKCSVGYSENSYRFRMKQFDRFCAQRFPKADAISEELVLEWSHLCNGESENNCIQRMIALKGFLDYLDATGIKTYLIPEKWIGRLKPCIPYLYSNDELECFFRGADTLPAHPLSKQRELIAPVVFRMHFCCGLRPQETVALRCRDVDLQDGTLYIADSKAHKDRLVPMSWDLCRLCQKYDDVISCQFPEREYFFQRTTERIAVTAEWQGDLFRACAKHAGMEFSKGKWPRVYDFRHNFATHVIKKWIYEGTNVSAMLPYLSGYMGHSSLKATAYYIHLVPEHLTDSGLTTWGGMPEVPDYED
ncbi:MAG: tyrosine-type recombinase/integrase [Lachnospiraceae bacterium]